MILGTAETIRRKPLPRDQLDVVDSYGPVPKSPKATQPEGRFSTLDACTTMCDVRSAFSLSTGQRLLDQSLNFGILCRAQSYAEQVNRLHKNFLTPRENLIEPAISSP